MSNRALVIGGLLAVALFVAAAFALMPEPEATSTLEPVQQIARPPPRHEPIRAVEAPAPVDAKAVAAIAAVDAGEARPAFEVAPVRGEATLSEDRLLPAVVAVHRIVAQCSADVAARYKQPHEVTLSFEVRADGEFATLVQPVVEKSSIKDPHFEACVADAPLDVQVPINAVGTARVRLPFRSGRTGE